MTDIESLRIVTRWVEHLCDLCNHPTDQRPNKSRIASYATHLAGEFPSGAFTQASAEHVAAGNAWFPAYADAKRLVHEWWAEHKPACAPRIAGPGSERLTELDRMWVALWHRRRPEAEAKQRSLEAEGRLAGVDPVQWPLAHLASYIRKHSPAAWLAISGEAPKPRRLEPTQAEVDAVHAVVASLPQIRTPTSAAARALRDAVAREREART